MRIRATKFTLLFVTITAFLVVGGCKIGPNYKQPNYDLGKNYRFAATADSRSLADTSWSYLLPTRCSRG